MSQPLSVFIWWRSRTVRFQCSYLPLWSHNQCRQFFTDRTAKFRVGSILAGFAINYAADSCAEVVLVLNPLRSLLRKIRVKCHPVYQFLTNYRLSRSGDRVKQAVNATGFDGRPSTRMLRTPPCSRSVSTAIAFNYMAYLVDIFRTKT